MHTPAALPLDLTVFANPGAAQRALARLQAQPRTAAFLAQHGGALAQTLPQTASPDRALLGLERLLGASQEAPEIVSGQAASAGGLRPLLAILGASPLLGEMLIRQPALARSLQDLADLARARGADQMAAELGALLRGAPADEIPDLLRSWQQGELLRIGSGDLLGLLDHATVTAQLSRLADVVIGQALAAAAHAMGVAPDALCVLALGKLGGGELNYSSDIDLLFLTRRDAAQATALAERLIHTLTTRTSRGFLYRVDMRLRPWGSAGPLVMSAQGFTAYVRRHARLWERQALLKARPVAGDLSLGQEELDALAPLIYAVPPDQIRADVRQSKERIEGALRQRGKEWGEVKGGIGSLRDIEFAAQALQLIHGAAHPGVRTANTLEALARLAEAGLLSGQDYRVLSEGYRFLRPVEHYLQLMHGRQTHTLPAAPGELAYLGRRLGFGGEHPGEQLVARYEQHAAAIRAVFERHLAGRGDASHCAGAQTAQVARHLRRMAPSYAETFSGEEVRRHTEMADDLGADNLVILEATPLERDLWQVTIVAYDYPGELSAICGLLTAYGCDIREGSVFTYEPGEDDAQAGRRKIVDVFRVQCPGMAEDDWAAYRGDLARLLSRLDAGEREVAQSELARLVADAVRGRGASAGLAPIVIELDNDSSPRYTALYISAPDTPGFLYEFSNALAVLGYHVARMTVESSGARAHDTLYLTDRHGRKVTDPRRQRELRAATALVKHFTHLLPQAPDPGRAMAHFQGFVAQLLGRSDWPAELSSLTRPPVLEALARLLGVSDFLWTDLLRLQHENLFPIIRDVEALAEPKSAAQLQAELEAELASLAPDFEAQAEALNAFKDREIFFTDMRHIQGYLESFGAFSEELSDVAEVVVRGAVRLCREALEARHGVPRDAAGAPTPLAVLALGKLGGREIGYASDIELLFLCGGEGHTDGAQPVSAAHFYEELVQRFLQVIQARREGIFEVDLRLRPYGEAGSLAVSLASYQRYFAPGGAAWPYERQALVRLRPIAGDGALAEQALALRDRYVYQGAPVDLTAIRAMRERQLRHLVAGGALNAKFSRGGLVDIEYLVQALQMRHGREHVTVRSPNTQRAMAALAQVGALAPEDYDSLREAHILIRHLIDALRMVRGNARDLTVPLDDADELAFLARRCSYGSDTTRFRQELEDRMAQVQGVVERLWADDQS
jgi:[glutamine synthetase] adenylyltransferase / [glutamine synthetase]-adenylyl-L-tyrosine phosphorylase